MDETTAKAAYERLPELVAELYAIVDALSEAFPGRHFTPDGHMVGSIGEVLAAWEFGLELAPASTAGFDGWTLGRKLTVEIKATQGDRVLLDAGISVHPDRLLALKLNRDGTHDVIYNGPGSPVWEAAGKAQKNGQRPVRLSTLRTLNAQVEDHQRLPSRLRQ